MNTNQIKFAFAALLTSLIAFYVSMGGNPQDFTDIVETEVGQYASITYVASDLPVPTEAIPPVETFIPPTRETAVFPTEVVTSLPKPTPTPAMPVLIQLKTEYKYEYANVRAKPSVDQAIVGKLYPGESRLLLKQVGEWYEIPLGSDARTGWIAVWLCVTLPHKSHPLD